MEWYWIVSIVLGGVFLLMLIPFWIQLRMYINIEYNIGAMSISVFGIKVLCFQAELSELGIKIMRSKKEDKEIKFSVVDENAIFLKNMVHRSMRMISIMKLEMYYDVGKENDAFKTSMRAGSVVALSNIILSWLYTKRGVFNASINTEENVKEDKLTIAVYTSIVVMPIVILYVYILAKTKTKKAVNIYERRTTKNQTR